MHIMILLAVLCGVCGFIIGKLWERCQWSALIHDGKLPAPGLWAKAIERLRWSVFWNNRDGSPCDGFRYREEVQKTRHFLEQVAGTWEFPEHLEERERNRKREIARRVKAGPD